MANTKTFKMMVGVLSLLEKKIEKVWGEGNKNKEVKGNGGGFPIFLSDLKL